MPVRVCEGRVLQDERKFYLFTLEDGRKVETKAHSEEEARRQIEELLGVELFKQAA